MLLQYEVVATSPTEYELRQQLLIGYNKDVHPSNDVHLIYQIVYLECPILDTAAGTIISKIYESQVCLVSFAS